jgi:hypothetical protein
MALERPSPTKKIEEPVTKSHIPTSTCIHFLKWYKKNEEKLHKIKILKGGGSDTSSNYSVNYDNTSLYLLELKKSGYLSKKYRDSLFAYIIRCNEILKKYPQNDGPAQGFEADLVMKSQDYMGIMENLDTYKILSKKRHNDSINIVLKFSKDEKMTFNLSRYNGKWLIDTINGNFPVEIWHY